MMNYIWAGMLVFSFITAIFFGNMQSLSDSITAAAENAVTIILELVGILMLWSGVMAVAEQAGLTQKISALLAPVLRRLFPDVPKRDVSLPLVTAMGRKSLLIYLLHQPLVYGALTALNFIGVI